MVLRLTVGASTRLVAALLALTACGRSSTPAAPPASASPEAQPTPAATGALAPVTGLPSQVVEKVQVGGQPCGVLAEFGSTWVTDAAGARLLQIEHGRVARTISIDATPCELTAGYGSLWVVTQSNRLDRVDPKSGRVLARIDVGATSYEAVAAFGAVWVTNRNGHSVSRVDPATNTVTRTVDTPSFNPGGIVAAAGQLWLGNDTGGARTVLRLDPQTLRLTPFIAGERPAFVAAAAGSVWFANQGDGTVSRLGERTGKQLATVPAGVSPVNLATLPGPSPEVWVPDDRANLLIRVDARQGAVIERMVVGNGPAVVAPDGTDVWVTNFGEGSVWRIRPGRRG